MKMMFFSILVLMHIIPLDAKTQIRPDTMKRNAVIFEREVPALKNGKLPSYYLNKGIVEHMLGLKSLENGFDSLQLRFWYAYARTDSSQLVIISRKNGQWSSQLLTFVYVVAKNGKTIESIKRIERLGYPKSGWTSFVRALLSMSVTLLPDENAIAGYPDYTDGNSIIVEVATKNSYRIYSYKEPMIAEREIDDAKKIEQALAIIEDQFSFKQLRKF